MVHPRRRDDELVLLVALALLPEDRVLGALLTDEGGPESRERQRTFTMCDLILGVRLVQGGLGGWPTGNGKKLSNIQAQLGQATCLAVA